MNKFYLIMVLLLLPFYVRAEGNIKEEIEKNIKYMKENVTIIKSDRYVIDISEKINEKAIYDSWPVVATVYDGQYGYKYSIALQGTKLQKAFLKGDYLYTYLSYLGSSYPSDDFECTWLHGWRQKGIIEDIAYYEFTKDNNIIAYQLYTGKGHNLCDLIGIAILGNDGMKKISLTGSDIKDVMTYGDDSETGNIKKYNWPAGLDRSRKWIMLSNFLWEEPDHNLYFVVGEKAQINEDREYTFEGIYLIKTMIKNFTGISVQFSAVSLKIPQQNLNIIWKAADIIRIYNMKDEKTKTVEVNIKDFKNVWSLPEQDAVMSKGNNEK